MTVPPWWQAAPNALALVEEAREQGIPAEVRRDRRFGYSAWVSTPFHDRPVRLVDELDLRYLTVELA